MRNSQYFGLMWVLSAIAAAVLRSGVVFGLFVLGSVAAGGLAIYFLMKETGLLDDLGASATDHKEAPARPAAAAAPQERHPATVGGNKRRGGGGTLVETPLAWMLRTIKSMRKRD